MPVDLLLEALTAWEQSWNAWQKLADNQSGCAAIAVGSLASHPDKHFL